MRDPKPFPVDRPAESGEATGRVPEVVELTEPDAPALRELIHAAFADYREKPRPSGALLETDESIAQELREGVRAIAVRVDGRLVAAAKVKRSRDRALVFSRLSVLPEERGRGWTRLLLDRLRAMAAESGARAIGCQVRADEAGLIAMYRHLGLEVTGEGMQQSLTGRVIHVVQMRAKV